MENRVRQRKTTKTQYEILITYMEQHPQLFDNKLTPNFTVHDRNEHWKALSSMLNREGPEKTTDKWKKVSIKGIFVVIWSPTYKIFIAGVGRLETVREGESRRKQKREAEDWWRRVHGPRAERN